MVDYLGRPKPGEKYSGPVAVDPTFADYYPASVRDKDDPRALIGFLDETLVEYIGKLPEKLLEKRENELRDMVKPLPDDYALRRQFWRAVENCVKARVWAERNGHAEDPRTIKVPGEAIYKGITGSIYFYGRFCLDFPRLAWLLCPLRGYHDKIADQLEVVTEKLWDLVSMPLTKSNGEVNVPMGNLLLQISKELANRVYGLPVARTISRNINTELGAAESEDIPRLNGVQELNSRIAELEGKLSSMQSHEPPQIEGEVQDDDSGATQENQ